MSTLDMRDYLHPRRTSESGEIEAPGPEVWVNFNYTGSGITGDYGDPFRTLAEARDKVAAGGTVKIMPGPKNEVITISKRMTIRAVPGPTTIGSSD